jgi:hypothetical protein
MGRKFKIGFMGAALPESAEWAAEQTQSAKYICVPFAGSCTDIAAMARDDTVIESWDTQLISRAVIDGVFKADEIKSNLADNGKPRYRKGYMYESRGLKRIDDHCAGFIDWVGAHGTLADKAALFSAAVRCTEMGRMTHWDSDINRFWAKFQKQLEYLSGFTKMPGEYIHHEASVFDEYPDPTRGYGHNKYDIVQIDPPKIVDVGGDIYSGYYKHINIALGGKCELPRWSWRDTVGYLRQIFSIDAERLLFMYVSDVRPTMDELRKVVSEYGEVEVDERFLHRNRYDYGMIVRKEDKHD